MASMILYSTLKGIGYHRETVNHSELFADPTTGALQTQTLECIGIRETCQN